MNSMTKEEIRDWLYSVGEDRHWLAEQIGCTYGTLSQWFCKGFPMWAVKSIRLLAETKNSSGSQRALYFNHEEWREIESAMREGGYSIPTDFYRDIILRHCRDASLMKGDHFVRA